MDEISLGPFVLEAPIGRGGMGEVWRGRHREQGIPVAAKVLSARISDDQSRLVSFRNEIHAVAGLDHPNIVWVLDAGTVDAAAERASKGRLVESNPYLVMELSTGGTLANLEVDSWDLLRDTLLTLLEALSHAHARGVAHLDLKPGNVLLSGPDDLRPGLKLTDFGIASALEETQESKVDTITGTLAYMAPEQIRADWREYGPWTDLYALGCLTWRLTTGRVPFTTKNPVALMRAQLTKTPPRLVDTRVPVPRGFDRWVGTLLEKVSWERFQCAADAAEALRALGTPGSDEPMPVAIDADSFADLPTVVVHRIDTSDLDEPTPQITPVVPMEVARLMEPVDLGNLAAMRPGLPRDWRRPGPGLRSPRLVGAGLSLFGVRAIPIVGREEERDALWAGLSEARRSGSARVVTLAGAAGTGKTLLARWLVERAKEVGAASVLRYRFEPGAPADEGLRLMLRRFFRVQRLRPEDRLARIRAVLERYDVESPEPEADDDEEEPSTGSEPQARSRTSKPGPRGSEEPRRRSAQPERRAGDPTVAEVIDALLDDASSPVRKTRYVAVRRVLEGMAGHRPLILWFDDVQWGLDGLRLVEHLLGAQRVRQSPILVVLGYRTDLMGERTAEANRLRLLESRRETRRISLAPLSHAEHAKLARVLLPLAPALAAQAAERTAGNPQFLHELVGDWIERDQLVLEPAGFELRDRVFEVPASMDAVWRLRILRLLHDLPDEAQLVLERAAVLGREVDDEEWQLACDDPEAHYARQGRVYFQPRLAGLRMELRHRMLKARIIEATDSGWTFAHAMLRHTLERMARESGRWAAHHRACATMLQHRERLRAGDRERLGRHLVEAGDPVEALGALLAGVEHREATVGYQAALGLLAYSEDALTHVLPPADARWGRLWARRAALYSAMEDVAEARRWASHAWDQAELHGWPPDVSAKAAFELGKVALYQRRAADADQWLARAVELFHPDEHFLRGSAWYSRSLAARYLPDVPRAQRHARQAAQHLSRVAREGNASAWRMLGTLALMNGELDRARGYMRKARARAQAEGDVVEMAEAWNTLADIARKQGDLEDAERGYRRTLELYAQAGAGDAVIYPMANLALVHLAREDWDAARESATALRAEVEWRNREVLLCAAHAALAVVSAGVGVFEDAAHHLERCRQLVEGADLVEADIAWCFERAGKLALKGRQRALARAALRMALSQYERLGDTQSVARLTSRPKRAGS